jgi:hypothetical protein
MALYQNPTLFNESVSARTATPTVALGTVRWEGGNQYRYVYCASTTGDSSLVGYAVRLLSGGSGYTVTNSMTTGDVVHGIVQDATLTTGAYGWVLRKGIGKVHCGTAGVGASKLMCVWSSGSIGNYHTLLNGIVQSDQTGADISTMFVNGVCGRTLGTCITNVSILAAIDCCSQI